MPAHRARRRHRYWPDVAGVGAVVALACAYLSPALKDGPGFGSFDLVLPLTSLGAGTYRLPAFNRVNSDSVSQMNVWNGLDWRAIHAGQFPLWNGLSLLGLPHFLNFESAVLSLPDLVSYAVPLRFAFLTAVLVKMVIAGTGAYLLARVVGLRPLGASFAGITFMLSGAFANWLAWPLSDVVAWLGWIAAFAILAYTRPGQVRYVAGLAVAVAFCGYGGFPEANVFVAVALVVMAVAVVLWAPLWRRWSVPAREAPGSGPGAVLAVSPAGTAATEGPQPANHPHADVAAGIGRVFCGVVAGALLAMPLWFPGVQILAISHRTAEQHFASLPARSLSLLLAQGYYGLPTGRNPFFLTGWNYYESVSYVGVVVVVLALVALVRWWRHPTVVALGACCLVVVLTAYQFGSLHLLGALLGKVAPEVLWARFRSVLGLPVGLLAGIGLETLRGPSRSRRVLLTYAAGTALAAAALVALALHGDLATPLETSVRERSLIWPFASLAVLVVAGLGYVATGGRQGAPRAVSALPSLGLWCTSAAFLLFAGVGINGYSHAYFPSTPAIEELHHIVGSALVGVDDNVPATVEQFVPVGFYPEVNVAYGIAEFTGHDPVLPQLYFRAFAPAEAKGGPGFFEPDITSVAKARRYGIGYILAAPAAAPVPGARLVARVAGDPLYAVPGASRLSLVPATGSSGRLLEVRHPSSSEWDSVTSTTGPARLVVRVSAVPGWHATIDGHPARLVRTDEVMWSLALPPGRHRVRVWYLPDRIAEGVAMAAGGALLLAALGGAGWWRRRGRGAGSKRGPAKPGDPGRSAGGAGIFSLASLLAPAEGPSTKGGRR